MDEPISAYCHHFHRGMEMIGRRWVPEIVRALIAGKSRFSEFSSTIPGLSDRVLSERLKALEADGLVTRTVQPDTPVRIEYRLTPKGEGLAEAIGAISRWAEAWVSTAEAQASTPQPSRTGG
jgi:DNA-binding HxlR family transcriptional regulator